MAERTLGCPKRKCKQLLVRSLLGHRGRALWCNNCGLKLQEAPFSCVQHDYDLCQKCYNIKLNAMWASPEGNVRQTRRLIVQAAPREPTPMPKKAARFQTEDAEDSAAEDADTEAPQTGRWRRGR